MDFKALNLIPQILKAAEDAGYETPSPIQQMAIPPVLQGRDLLGCAQTGTGKTAAFAMPILQNLMATRGAGRVIRALILTPTRELAMQIYESFEEYGKNLPIKSCVIFGGVGQTPQVDKIKRGVDILVATPGRLLDLCTQGHIKLNNLEIFVLDEADRMLDMGFVHDVKRVLKLIPAKRQTLLFSATMPKEIEDLAASMLNNPQEVYITPPATTVELIKQSLYKVDKVNKRFLLSFLLKDKSVNSALVFTRTKHGADRVVRELEKEGIHAAAIHGNKSQNARQNALNAFKNGEMRVLVATDIAARGIDISELSHVINYDLPDVPETYVHRIGRTGRAGLDGIAISFCCFDEMSELADIEKTTRQAIPEVKGHDWPMQVFESVKKEPQQRPARRSPQEKQQKPAQKAAKTPRAERAPLRHEPKPIEPPKSSRSDDEQKRKTRRGGKSHRSSNSIAEQAPRQPQSRDGGQAQQGAPRQPQSRDGGQAQQGAPRQPQSRDARAQQRPSQHSSSATPQKAQGHERDNAMQVITKKAPKQKFTSFEDFFKSSK